MMHSPPSLDQLLIDQQSFDDWLGNPFCTSPVTDDQNASEFKLSQVLSYPYAHRLVEELSMEEPVHDEFMTETQTSIPSRPTQPQKNAGQEDPPNPRRSSSGNGVFPSKEDWDRHKEAITYLYHVRKLPLARVMEIMEEKHGLIANKSMYKKRFDKWNLGKSYKKSEVVAIKTIERTQKFKGNPTAFFLRNSLVDMKAVNKAYNRDRPYFERAIEAALSETQGDDTAVHVDSTGLQWFIPPSAPRNIASPFQFRILEDLFPKVETFVRQSIHQTSSTEQLTDNFLVGNTEFKALCRRSIANGVRMGEWSRWNDAGPQFRQASVNAEHLIRSTSLGDMMELLFNIHYLKMCEPSQHFTNSMLQQVENLLEGERGPKAEIMKYLVAMQGKEFIDRLSRLCTLISTVLEQANPSDRFWVYYYQSLALLCRLENIDNGKVQNWIAELAELSREDTRLARLSLYSFVCYIRASRNSKAADEAEAVAMRYFTDSKMASFPWIPDFRRQRQCNICIDLAQMHKYAQDYGQAVEFLKQAWKLTTSTDPHNEVRVSQRWRISRLRRDIALLQGDQAEANEWAQSEERYHQLMKESIEPVTSQAECMELDSEDQE